MLSISTHNNNVAFSSNRPKLTPQPQFGNNNAAASWQDLNNDRQTTDNKNGKQINRLWYAPIGLAALLAIEEAAIGIGGRALGWWDNGGFVASLFDSNAGNNTLGNIAGEIPTGTNASEASTTTRERSLAPPPPVVLNTREVVDANGTNAESNKVAIGDAYTESVVIRNGEEVTTAQGGLTADNYAAFYQDHLTSGKDRSYINGFGERGLTTDEVIEGLKMVHGSGISDWRYENSIKTKDDGTQYVDITFLTAELPRNQQREVSPTAPRSTYRASTVGITGATTIEEFAPGEYSITFNQGALQPSNPEIGLTADELIDAYVHYEDAAENLRALSKKPGNSEPLVDETGNERPLQRMDFRAAMERAKTPLEERMQRVRAARTLGIDRDDADPDAK